MAEIKGEKMERSEVVKGFSMVCIEISLRDDTEGSAVMGNLEPIEFTRLLQALFMKEISPELMDERDHLLIKSASFSYV